jgi:predicted MFS family arabinose efflux permease
MTRGQRRTWLPLTVLSLGAFTTVLNATQLSPLLKPIAGDLGVSEGAAGQLATVSAVVGTLVALLVAPWMDRFSRRRWLQGQAAALIVATLFSALAPTFAWLVAARVLAGLGGAVIMANCFTAVGELYPDAKRRDRAVGVIVTATTVAIVAGLPILAQIEAVAGWRWAVAFSLLPLTLLFVGARWLPVAPPPASAVHQDAGAGYRRVLGHRPTLGLLGAMGVFALAYVGWLTYFGAYAETDFGADANTLGALFLVAGAAEMVANNLTPPLLRRVSPRRIFAVATAIMAADLLATDALFSGLWTLFVSIAVLSVCAAALYIAGNALLLDALPGARGTVMALSSASVGGGAALGSLVGGAALATFGGYAAVYRLLGLLLSLGIVAMNVGRRGRALDEPVALPAPA